MLLARVIMWFEDREDSHCEILRVENGDLENSKSYGSVFYKSRIASYQQMKRQYECKKVIPLMVTNIDNADKLLGSMIGKPYSLVQLIVIAAKIVLGSGFKWLGKVNLNLSKYLICTELCGVFMRDAGDYRLSSSPDLLELDEVEHIALARLVD